VPLRYRARVPRLFLLAAIAVVTATPFSTPFSMLFSGSFSAPAQGGETDYSAVGPGHYIRTVTDEGQFVTLEDASRWEIDPRVRFRSVEWQADEVITVRRGEPEDGFRYELDNIDRDNGVLATYLPRRD
jgi:hypothetical protein